MRSLPTLLLLSVVLPCAGVAAAMLAVDGRTDYVIVTPQAPSPSVQRAAEELRRFLRQITGAEYAVATADRAPGRHVGRSPDTPCVVDHRAFTVTPQTEVGASIERFLARGKQARVLSMSERRFTLAQYEESLAILRQRHLEPHRPVEAKEVRPGVRARYYEFDAWPRGTTFEKMVPTADAVVPVIGLESRKRDSMFGFLEDGLIHAPVDGVYVFHLRAEGSSYLQVAGEMVVDAQRTTAKHSVPGYVALRAGWHPIRLRFREHAYNDGLDLTWEIPDRDRARIGPESFGHLAE